MQRIGGRADFGQPDIARLGPGLDDRNDVAERPLLGVGHGFLLLKGAFDIHSSSFSAVADGFTVDNSASPTASRTITGTNPACWYSGALVAPPNARAASTGRTESG